MNILKRIFSVVFAVAILICCIPATDLTAAAADYTGWVGAWGSPAIESGVVVGSDSVLSQNGIHLRDYIPTNSTIRTTVVPTVSGSKIRLKFSNLFGSETVTINEVTVAKTGSHDDEILTDTVKQVTFNGGYSYVNIAAGSEIYSDEISFNVTALEKISISSYFKNTTPMYVVALYGGTAYLGSSLGNRTHKSNLTSVASKLNFNSNSITYNTIPFLTRVDVYAPGGYTVVILGDSTVTNNSYIYLAQKLQANNITNVGVVMSGIIGNSLLNDGHGLLGKVYGQALLTRAKRDAFDIPGVKYVIAKVGANDILHPMTTSMMGQAPVVSTNQIIQGYKDLAAMAADKGVQLYLCTRTPYKGYERNFVGSVDLVWSADAEKKLCEINSWIRGSSKSYYINPIDLDYMRDPEDSTKLRSQLTTDGIHFSDLGQIAFVDLLPESAYGVKTELRDLSAITGKNPYVIPAATTKAPTQNNNSGSSGSSNNNSSEQQTNSTPQVGTTAAPNQIASAQESTTALIPTEPASVGIDSANQIFVDNNDSDDFPGMVVDDQKSSSSSSRQMVGFIILAVVAVVVIAFSAGFLIKMKTPSSGRAPVAGRGMGKTRQKSKV